VQFRVATISDAEAIRLVINSAFGKAEGFLIDRDRVDSEAVHAFLEKGKFLVADDAGTLAGCVYVELRGERVSWACWPSIPTFRRLASAPRS
jgi:N-acetylglutamate synthase-like GNAT family acetyltransferase